MPTPLTPPNPDRTNSEPSHSTPPSSQRAGITQTNVFSTPSGETSLARRASPFHYNTAAVAPNSAKVVYTTATAIPTEFCRTHTDDDATSSASTSTRFADRLYVFRRHERLDLLCRSVWTTCPFIRTRVRPLEASHPLSALDPGTTAAAQHARHYNTTALHLYMRRYTSPKHQTFYARFSPLLLHPPTNREVIAADNASDLASDFRRATYRTGCLTRNAYACGVAHQLRAPNVLYVNYAGTNLLAPLVLYTRKHTQPLQLGHRQLVPGERLHNALTRFLPTIGPSAYAILYSHNSRPTQTHTSTVQTTTLRPTHRCSFRCGHLRRHVGFPSVTCRLVYPFVRHPPRHFMYTL
jgi:hypothetical protein